MTKDAIAKRTTGLPLVTDRDRYDRLTTLET